MLRLGDEVGSNASRIPVFACHDDLSRAGRHVDTRVMRDSHLCGGHVEIAGADDFVDREITVSVP